MKKSLIALAVSSAVVAPASAQAAEAYGTVHVGFESASTDGGGTSLIFNTTGDDSGGGAQDTFESKFGFSGSEDLGNGLTAGYTLEFGINTSSTGAGATNEDVGVATRLSNVTLGGDFGMLKLGTQYGVLYEYSGWNHGRTLAHGFGGHYWFFNTASGQTTDPSALRIDNAYTYTYGGGGYSSDPFTFSVQVQSNGNDETAAQNTAGIDDEETIDAVILGGQGTFGDFTVNATFLQESNTDSSAVQIAEPTIFSLGGRWSSGPFYVGGTFYQADNDLGNNPGATASDKPTAILALAGMDFGDGYNAKVGFGTGDADRGDGDGDMSNFYVEGSKALSSRTTVYAEFETASQEDIGTGGSDAEEDIFAVGLVHNF